MRLGSYHAKLKDNLIKKFTNQRLLKKDIDIDMRLIFIKRNLRKRLIFSGISPDNKLPEIIELKIILGL